MNNQRHEIRLAGSGGQGINLATIILAEAAVQAGKYTTQSESYGPEARGGSCKAETLIDNVPIGYTKVQTPTLLMAFTQKALDQYTVGLPHSCVVLIDSSLTKPSSVHDSQVISLPFLATARNVIGRVQTANIMALGFINEYLTLFDRDTMVKAVLMHIPKGTDALNIKALEIGMTMAQDWKKDHICENS